MAGADLAAGGVTLDTVEQGLIGAIVARNETMDAVRELGVRSRHFASAYGANAFQACERLLGQGRFDGPMLLDALRGSQERADSAQEHWVSFGIGHPYASPHDAAGIVLQRHRYRVLSELGQTMSYAAKRRDPPAEVITEAALKKLQQISEAAHTTEDDGDIGDDLRQVIDHIHNAKAELRGTPTGSAFIDMATLGLREGRVWVVGASPSVGKSALLLGIALYMAVVLGIHVAYYSLEMLRKELIERAIANLARVDGTKIQLGGAHRFGRSEMVRVSDAYGALDKSGLRIFDDPRVSVSDIIARAPALRREGVQHIFIDHFGLLKHTRQHGSNSVQNMMDTGQELKRCASVNKMGIVVAHQLTKEATRKQKDGIEPGMADLRDCPLEQDADTIMLIHRPEHFRGDKTPDDQKGKGKIIVAKNRGGRVGSRWVGFQKEATRFFDLEER